METYSKTGVGTHFDLRNTIGRRVPTRDVTYTRVSATGKYTALEQDTYEDDED